MKLKTLFALLFTLTVGALSVAQAQQPAATRPAGAAAPATTTASSNAKLGVVYTELFRAPQGGIQRLVNAATSVEREFQPRVTELQNLQRQMETGTEALQKKASVQAPEATRAETERLEQMKREYDRKAEDAQFAFNKRLTDVMSPLSENINTALQAFAKQRGISLLFDGSKFVGGLVVLDEGVDITNEFIADYNRRNPATAAATTPPRTTPTPTRP